MGTVAFEEVEKEASGLGQEGASGLELVEQRRTSGQGGKLRLRDLPQDEEVL